MKNRWARRQRRPTASGCAPPTTVSPESGAKAEQESGMSLGTQYCHTAPDAEDRGPDAGMTPGQSPAYAQGGRGACPGVGQRARAGQRGHHLLRPK